MKHTPGPWKLLTITEEFTVAAPFGWHRIVGANGISPGIVFGGLEECAGNARLIETTPELLDALQAIIDSWNIGGKHTAEYIAEAAALLKRIDP